MSGTKPHSYEFLKQQMRELKKELSIEKRATTRFQNASALPGPASKNLNIVDMQQINRMGSNEAFNHYKSNAFSPRNSNNPTTNMQSTGNNEQKLFDGRATSLPKIASRVKLTQF